MPTPTRLLALLPVLLLALTVAACGSDEDEVAMHHDDVAEEMHDDMHDDDLHGEAMDGEMPAYDDNVGAMQGAPPMGSAQVRMEDGMQVAHIEVGREGYQPRQLRLEAGVPTRLVFTRRIEGDCPSHVEIPAFDVPSTELPMHEPVAIEFTPDESGTFTFACGMDMMEGTLMVES